MDRVARRGPLARAPGALKEGHFRNCQHFCRSWRGFVAKHQKIEGGKFLFSEKNLSAGKYWKGDPLEFSNIHSVAKQQKIEGGTLWGKNFPEKKSRSAEKNWKGGPFGIFQHPFCRKTAKNWEGPFGGKNFPEKKSRSAEKNWKGGPFGLAGYGMLRGKTFWFSSLDQIVQFGAIIFYRTFVELFWSVRVDWKKKKSHHNSRVSLHEAPSKNVVTCLHFQSALYANFFRHCETFFRKIFFFEGSPFNFLLFWDRMDVGKSQRVPPSNFFRHCETFFDWMNQRKTDDDEIHDEIKCDL